MAFIAGPYTVQYDSADLGEVEDGFTIRYFINKRLIITDSLADVPQDAVFQGEEMFVAMNVVQEDTGASPSKLRLLTCPYSDGVWGTIGQVGILDSSKYKPLVLTDTTGTPAEGNPASFTFDRTIFAEDVPFRMNLGPDLRSHQVVLRVYPNASGQFWS